MIKPNERLDDLEYKGLMLIQDPDGYCFTSDSVLLANLAEVKRLDTVVDIGTGSGIVAILIAAKFAPRKVIGLEIQPRLASMAQRSVVHNRLEDVVEILNIPAQGAEKIIGNNYDVVVSNPPYDKPVAGAGESEKEICKTEIKLSVEETVISASRLLKYGGKFFMVVRASRLTDALSAMRANKIEPKKLYLIQPKSDKDVDTVVIAGKKGGKSSLIVPRPIVIYNEDGTMTDEAKKIYNK